MNKDVTVLNIVVGFSATGPAFVGVIALIAAVIPFFNGDFVGAGLLLISSSISFGLLATAVLGK